MGEGEYKKYVDGYLIRNKVHEMYLRKVNKLASNSFDDKRKYIELVPWEIQN